MEVLKDCSKLPHGIALLKLENGAAGATPPVEGMNDALQDAVVAVEADGGYTITESQALALATVLFPATQIEIEGVTYDVSNPKLVDGVLKRDITEAT